MPPEEIKNLADLQKTLLALPAEPVLRVAIDGVDGAGKTTLADALALGLRAAGAQVIRASVDGFHFPRAIRYRQGPHSPQGFYQDSYDYARLRAVLLDPLSVGGNLRYRTAIFDHRQDLALDQPELQAVPGSLLILDGIFLHRPELRHYWDYSVFLALSFEVSVARMAVRDGSDPDPQALSNRRYVEGQKRYLKLCQPEEHAHLVLDYTQGWVF